VSHHHTRGLAHSLQREIDVEGLYCRMCVCVHIHLYVCMCVCMCACVYIYTYMYTYILIYIFVAGQDARRRDRKVDPGMLERAKKKSPWATPLVMRCALWSLVLPRAFQPPASLSGTGGGCLPVWHRGRPESRGWAAEEGWAEQAKSLV